MKDKILSLFFIITATITIGCGGGSENGASEESPKYLLFAASDAEHGRELWKTDGTADGTVFIMDIYEGPEVSSGEPSESVSKASGESSTTGSGNPAKFVWFKNKYYFSAQDGVNGLQVWESDGTSAGTKKVTSSSGWNSIHEIVKANGKLYFTVSNSNNDYVFCESDGTNAGTKELYTNPGSLESSVALNGKTYFVCNSAGNILMWELDSVNGLKRAAGTEDMAMTLDPYVLNGKIFFSNWNTGLIYSYDGSAIVALTDISTNPNPKINGVFNGKLFFSTYVTSTGPTRLWATDGTAAGTKDLGIVAERPEQMTAFNGKVYYMRSTYMAETDGVSQVSETALNADGGNLIVFKNNLYFTLWQTVDGSTKNMLYKYNGTVTPDAVSIAVSYSSSMQIFNEHLLFAGDESATGNEVWISDGTDSGTKMLKDIYTGTYIRAYDGKECPNSSDPFQTGKY